MKAPSSSRSKKKSENVLCLSMRSLKSLQVIESLVRVMKSSTCSTMWEATRRISAFFVREGAKNGETLAEVSLDKKMSSRVVSLKALKRRAESLAIGSSGTVSTGIGSTGTTSTVEIFSGEEHSVDDMVMVKSSLTGVDIYGY